MFNGALTCVISVMERNLGDKTKKKEAFSTFSVRLQANMLRIEIFLEVRWRSVVPSPRNNLIRASAEGTPESDGEKACRERERVKLAEPQTDK